MNVMLTQWWNSPKRENDESHWASHDSTGSPVSPLSVCFRSCCLKSFEIRSFSLTCAAVSLCIIILSRANSRLKLCWETPVRDSDLVDSLSGQPQMHMSWCKFSHIRTDTSWCFINCNDGEEAVLYNTCSLGWKALSHVIIKILKTEICTVMDVSILKMALHALKIKWMLQKREERPHMGITTPKCWCLCC